MSYRVQLKTHVVFYNDIIIKKPVYMTKEEFLIHIEDAKDALGDSFTFEQFLCKLEDMGFDVLETLSDFITKKDKARAEVVHIFDTKDETY